MAPTNKLHIGMSLAPTWLSGKAWRRKDSAIEGLYTRDYFIDIAKRSEAAKLDFVFLPDILYLNMDALKKGAGFSSLDPSILLSSIAHETSHIGLLTTISTTFCEPYIVARQLQSLNWLSKGRIGWNIVTAIGGQENFGLTQMPTAQERYARAREFVDAVQQLWSSFPSDALTMDRDQGRFIDTDLLSPINFEGDHFTIKGPLSVPAYPTDRIPFIQAGASPDGRDFASSIADAIFAAAPNMQAACELRQDLQNRAVDHGRNAQDIRILPGLSLYLADSRAEARELYLETHADADKSVRLKTVMDMTGMDFTDWPDDKPITTSDLPDIPAQVRSRTHAELLHQLIRKEEPTLKDLLNRPEVMGSSHWQVIGTVDDAVETVRNWQDAGAIDGFIAVPGGSVSSMHLCLDQFIPELSAAGLFRKDYDSTSFLGHLLQS